MVLPSPMARTDEQEATNGGSSVMIPLEIEEEMMSLFEETAGGMSVVSKITFRQKSTKQIESDRASSGFRGLLRSKTAYTLRNILCLCCLGLSVFIVTRSMDNTIENLTESDATDKRGPHQSSFGGTHNTASLAGAKAHNKHSEGDIHGDLTIEIPMYNIGQRVPSVSFENAVNHIGHYWHDPARSPWSSHLYHADAAQLDEEQLDFLVKMNRTKEKYGTWDLVDPYFDNHGTKRPEIDLVAYENRDAPQEAFLDFAWQADQEYVSMFVVEAKKLIMRAKEAIYEQYGHPSKDPNGEFYSDEILKERNSMFGIITGGYTVNDLGEAVGAETNEKIPGIAYLGKNAWDGLQRKLLHAMITKDDFFVVLVGDGNAAGHGNNFFQSSVMHFHYIMEPILDVLGVRLVSRNMAMKNVPTLLSALAGSDIYGEADILLYSSKTEELEGELDLVYKQSIMSGETVPLILTNRPGNLMHETNGAAWIGNLQPGHEICDTRNEGSCNFDAFNSVCWVDRTDFVPNTPQADKINPESYDGYRTHQLEGLKLALLVLDALDAALDSWVDGIESDGFPLSGNHWHVGNVYEQIREAVRTFKEGDDELSECEKTMGDLRIICRVAMHGFTEYTPRVTPYFNSLLSLLAADMDVANSYKGQIYEGIDLLPLVWKVSGDEVDIHAVAISTSPPAADGNDDYNTLNDDDFSWWNADDDAMLRRLDEGKLRYRLTDEAEGKPNAESETKLVAGKGWNMLNPLAGFCDGSAQSTCGRDAENSCLLAGHNDYQSGIVGDGLSGWLKLKVENVKEGIILVRLDTNGTPSSNTATLGWTEVNDGGMNRALLSRDFWFDFAIDGKVTTWSRTDFIDHSFDIAKGVTIYPLLMDKTMYQGDEDKGKNVEVAMRIRSRQGRVITMALTHLFYA
jgi:hypothetical protein